MSLRLITGPANVGKTEAVFDEALAAVAAGVSATLVVPSRLNARRLEEALSTRAPLGIRVTPVERYVQDLWSMLGDGRRLVEPATREAIVIRLLDEAQDANLGKTTIYPGLRRMVARLVSLDSGGMRASACPPWLLELLEQYRETVSDLGCVELAEAYAEIAANGLGTDELVGFVRFDTMSSAIARLAVGLARTDRVVCTLTWQQGFTPTRGNDHLVARLSELADEHTILRSRAHGDELEQLASVLYTGASAVSPSGRVLFGTGSGMQAECEVIAKLASAEIASGTPAARIAIALPHIASRRDALAASLMSADIDFEVQQREPLCSSALGRALRGLVNTASGRGTRVDALEFGSSRFSGAGRNALEAADRSWRGKPCADSRDLLGALQQCGSATRALVELAQAVWSEPLNEQSAPVWQNLLDSMLAVALESPGRNGGEGDGAAHQAVSRMIAEMCGAPNAGFDPADVVEAMASAGVRFSPEEREGAVKILPMDAIAGRRFDVVIVGGMSDKEIPLVPGDSAVDELMRAEGFESAADSPDLQRLGFYSVLTCARERIAFVRQVADSNGEGLQPSAFWEDLLDAYRSPTESDADTAAGGVTNVLSMSALEIETLSPAHTTGRREDRRAAETLKFEQLDRSGIRTGAGRAALGQDRVFSATEIETYLQCPYRWFYERVVRPEEIDERVDARSAGVLAHGLLGEFYRWVETDTTWRRVRPQNLAAALTKFEELAASHALRAQRTSVYEELGVERAVAMARRVIRQDAVLLPGFAPAHTEFAFGGHGSFVFGGPRLRGRIDRIDVGPDVLFVTDYKSSRTIPGLAKLEDEAKVQLMVYAVAAGEALERPVAGATYRSMQSGELRGFWRTDLLGDAPLGASNDDGIDERAFFELVERTEARVGTAVSAMQAGVVPRSPSMPGGCAYCPVLSVCDRTQR